MTLFHCKRPFQLNSSSGSMLGSRVTSFVSDGTAPIVQVMFDSPLQVEPGLVYTAAANISGGRTGRGESGVSAVSLNCGGTDITVSFISLTGGANGSGRERGQIPVLILMTGDRGGDSGGDSAEHNNEECTETDEATAEDESSGKLKRVCKKLGFPLYLEHSGGNSCYYSHKDRRKELNYYKFYEFCGDLGGRLLDLTTNKEFQYALKAGYSRGRRATWLSAHISTVHWRWNHIGSNSDQFVPTLQTGSAGEFVFYNGSRDRDMSWVSLQTEGPGYSTGIHDTSDLCLFGERKGNEAGEGLFEVN